MKTRAKRPFVPPGQDLSGLKRVPGVYRQVAALAWLPGPEPRTFVLVTSRRTGRWVFPKGNIDPGMTPHGAAAQEALEEAGVVGTARTRPVGQFRALKIRPPEYWDVKVVLYPMKVDEVLPAWQEQDERDRRFVTLREADGLMDDPAMIALARKFLAPRG